MHVCMMGVIWVEAVWAERRAKLGEGGLSLVSLLTRPPKPYAAAWSQSTALPPTRPPGKHDC